MKPTLSSSQTTTLTYMTDAYVKTIDGIHVLHTIKMVKAVDTHDDLEVTEYTLWAFAHRLTAKGTRSQRAGDNHRDVSYDIQEVLRCNDPEMRAFLEEIKVGRTDAVTETTAKWFERAMKPNACQHPQVDGLMCEVCA